MITAGCPLLPNDTGIAVYIAIIRFIDIAAVIILITFEGVLFVFRTGVACVRIARCFDAFLRGTLAGAISDTFKSKVVRSVFVLRTRVNDADLIAKLVHVALDIIFCSSAALILFTHADSVIAAILERECTCRSFVFANIGFDNERPFSIGFTPNELIVVAVFNEGRRITRGTVFVDLCLRNIQKGNCCRADDWFVCTEGVRIAVTARAARTILACIPIVRFAGRAYVICTMLCLITITTDTIFWN